MTPGAGNLRLQTRTNSTMTSDTAHRPFIASPLRGDIQMSQSHDGPLRILRFESAGFILLIVMAWMDDYHQTWHESALESLAVLAVWGLVFMNTRRLLSRLHYLEGFVRVCGWCRKIGHGDRWMPMEEYFSERFHTVTTHGMCPDCAASFKTDAGKPPETAGETDPLVRYAVLAGSGPEASEPERLFTTIDTQGAGGPLSSGTAPRRISVTKI